GLVDIIGVQDVDVEVRHQAARAIAFGGITPDMVTQLQGKLKDPNARSDAALALIIGGDADTASRALLSYNDASPESMEELKTIYNQSFGYWSDKNYENGDVARWIANAQALTHVRVRGALQDWPKMLLERAIQGIEFDNGPHSITRVQFRMRLMADAMGQDEKKRADAIAILKFMKEKGVLMALRNEQGPLGEMARQAFFEVMNPKLTDGSALPPAATASGSSAQGGNLVPPTN
ncbi:MAG: HEAT repeat domain-containing protein, partial [Polyangiaceae bacterium]